jgi:hypothetical protein
VVTNVRLLIIWQEFEGTAAPATVRRPENVT